ncbi:MAG: (Fe-S)-binding protein [Deltaproteobacteria bacterium]|nr:(Fe-S)-binding protein [Deltaproteobacteria bacterium]
MSAVETVSPITEIIDEIKKSGGEAFKYCYQCGKCDTVCPWNLVTDFSIRKIVRQATLGLPEIEIEDLWRCTTCGLCPSQCPRGVEQIEVGVAIRRIASNYGVFPGSVRAIRTVRGSLTTDGNPLGEDRNKRDAWTKDLSIKPFAEGMEILYFVGCYYSYDPRMRKAAAATVGILKKAGVKFGILGNKESCCGESIRKTGNEDVFKALAKDNIKTFIDNGVKRILVSSPHCYHTFKNEYSEFMVHFDVVHISQFLLELIEQGRIELTGEVKKKITYHDPCYLGRHNGIFDQPRDVLKNIPGLELVEMRNNRQNSLCCGGGGGRIWMDTPKGQRFADLRLAQAKEAGAEMLVTACPYCISNFEESRLALGDEETLEIKDITEIVWASLKESEETP